MMVKDLVLYPTVVSYVEMSGTMPVAYTPHMQLSLWLVHGQKCSLQLCQVLCSPHSGSLLSRIIIVILLFRISMVRESLFKTEIL